MTTIRLRCENGYLIPLDPLPDLKDGDEIEAAITPIAPPLTAGAVQATLEATRGIWADMDGLEDAIGDARDKWDQAWRDHLASS